MKSELPNPPPRKPRGHITAKDIVLVQLASTANIAAHLAAAHYTATRGDLNFDWDKIAAEASKGADAIIRHRTTGHPQ